MNFRRRPGLTPAAAEHGMATDPAVDDLKKYAHDATPDDYRHRMAVNIAAFVFVAALVVAGLWLADTMANMRKNQDCVLSGRRGCTPVDVPARERY